MYLVNLGRRKDIEVAIYAGLDNRTRKLFKVCIKLGWKQLHKYDALLTSAAYVGAVVFNPAKKWRLLDQLWSRVPTRKAQGWRADYEEKLLQIWENSYSQRDVDIEVLATADEASMDYIERRLARSVASSAFATTSPATASNLRKTTRMAKQTTTGAAINDEYSRYCAEDIVNSQYYRSRPIDWWKTNAYRYPRLSTMAVDMLSIPSSSAEIERTFSSAGLMMAPLRNRLGREIVAMGQCIRSWSKVGIYTPSLPLLSLSDDQWVEVLCVAEGHERLLTCLVTPVFHKLTLFCDVSSRITIIMMMFIPPGGTFPIALPLCYILPSCASSCCLLPLQKPDLNHSMSDGPLSGKSPFPLMFSTFTGISHLFDRIRIGWQVLDSISNL